MKDDPLVSIIITTYKRADNLDRAIVSALQQTYRNIEIIVVDDNGVGSFYQKTTEQSVENYVSLKEIKYIAREYNGGGGEARNTGIELSQGEYITFLDDDDEYLDDKVEKQVRFLEKGYDICLSSMIVRKENGEEIFPNWSYARGNSVKDFILNGNSYTPMIMARTDLIKKVGGFDSVKMLQDHIFMLKMLRSFPRLISIKDKLYVHNIHSNERVSKKKSIDCYLLKQSMENEFISILNFSEKKSLKFKHSKELALLYSEKNEYSKSIKTSLDSLRFVCNFHLMKEFVKLMLRVSVGPRGYNIIEKIKEKNHA
ncbi:glycosyltransferase family 2 protein [Klebsiella michiganensis]|uniref:Glycosyltransferase family 2 protein n=4 Tax=Klebsiella TaxID=570 RepID=A0AAX3CWI9_9ENTR|nr:glycosyltransferase family 2 protein [Klebsiella michiganensis]AUW09220.1 glycosyltransferase family 2 protein [Klebsiella oxytoca]BAT23760.1 glycosyl transferase [Klebsiella sp. 6177]EKP1128870.1 glycosyltransferase family 2 protein [Klebsiella michiganensis]MDU6583557.1 glycosyltransferase family 2 protein [Klebsiella michiganensis]MEB7683429.1 glycosyltransferase family 2 protein [Klebsiella michiganensis]